MRGILLNVPIRTKIICWYFTDIRENSADLINDFAIQNLLGIFKASSN